MGTYFIPALKPLQNLPLLQPFLNFRKIMAVAYEELLLLISIFLKNIMQNPDSIDIFKKQVNSRCDVKVTEFCVSLLISIHE